MVLAQMFLDAVIAVLKKARRGTLCLLDRSLNTASNREFLASGLHRARRMKPFLLTLLAFALTMAACSSSDPTSTVTSPSAGPPATIFMGVGIGTPSATTCATISGDSTIAPASTTAQLTGTLAAGSYCVQVYDVGNEASPVTYSVTVAHT